MGRDNDKRNLRTETMKEIEESGHSLSSIEKICSGPYEIQLEDFLKIADLDYDSGYGTEYVAQDLVIRFTDGMWLERSCYDGAECWILKGSKGPETHIVRGKDAFSCIWNKFGLHTDFGLGTRTYLLAHRDQIAIEIEMKDGNIEKVTKRPFDPSIDTDEDYNIHEFNKDITIQEISPLNDGGA